MSAVKVIKLYGERNTGTNYVSELLARNFETPQLGGAKAHQSKWLYRVAKVLRKSGQYRLLKFLKERNSNKYFDRNFDQTLGWKHVRVPVDTIAEKAPEGLGVIAVIKNPYSFILSLHRRPYHGKPVESLETFVAAPFRQQKRELMNGIGDLTPAQLWNEKVASYCALEQKIPLVQILRYEDFLADEEGVLDKLADAWQLPRAEQWQSVEKSTKPDAHDANYYRDYYLGEKWRSKLSDSCLDVINSQLDFDLLDRFGYSRIEAARAAQ